MTKGALPVKPPVPIKYLLWDGTDPIDSFALGNGLEQRFRSENLLNSSPASEEFCSTASKGKPRVYEPAGPTGETFTFPLFFRARAEFPNTFFSPMHHNALSELPHILAFSGHGIPGFMFSNSALLIACSRPITETGTSWSFTANPMWNNPNTKLVIFSACRQLAGRPQQFFWSQAMRGANPVHCILTYRNTAPAASTSADINRTFLANSATGQTFINAWKNAHTNGDLPVRWAALCYRSAVKDSLRNWARSGSLSSTPNQTTEDILYFDSENSSGRVVTQPMQIFDMFLTTNTVAGQAKSPPWSLFAPGTSAILHAKWMDSTNNFQDGDLVWISALQVRPDYGGPFNIDQLFTINGSPSAVTSFGYCHDASRGWDPLIYTDTYGFTINGAASSWLTHDASWNELQIPITLGAQQNEHLPLFYFMIRVQRGTTEFGVPTDPPSGTKPRLANQAKLVDDFQFCVFWLNP